MARERLAIQDTTTDAVVRDVHRQQGAANVSVRNIITSLRLISDVDWKELFERLSLVDAVLADRRRTSRTWIFQRGRSTAAPSRNCRAARTEPNWKSPAQRSLRHSKPKPTRQQRSGPDGAIPDIICSPAGAAPSKRRSPIALACEPGRHALTDRSASAAM